MRSPTRTVRRMSQTVRSFDHGLRLLADLARPDDGQQGVEFRLRGGRGTISCPNVPGARVPVYEVFAEDAYRLQALTAGLPEDLVAVDIGAHIGCFSVALALARPRATVHAWEASPSTARWLRRNLVANGLEDRVVAHDRAVSDHRGTLHLADNSRGSALNGLTATAGTLVEVPCVPVADVFAAAGGEVQLVKIDTEGAEYALVLGSDPKAWSSVQRVVLEWHDVPGHSWAELAEFFARAGLRVTDVEQSAPRQGTAWLAR